MWREDVVLPDGTVQRVRKSEIIGTRQDYKTKCLAKRAFVDRLKEVNSLAYKPRPTATFADFAARWQRDVLSQHKRSTQSAERSRIVLPDAGLVQEAWLTLDEMKLTIDAAPEPYKTYYWILAETGIRCGEACGLPTKNLLLDLGAIKVTQKVWHGQIETVKSKKGNRICEISPQLVEHLRGYMRTWRPNRLGLVFATKNGTPWDADVVRKRKLYPLLKKLNIRKCGFHAFRHGNETVMDGENVPMATRVNRLGHSDPRMTMRYTHAISEDGRRIAARFGELLAPPEMMPAGNA